MRARVCLVSQLEDERSPWTEPGNEVRSWAAVLEGDTRSFASVVGDPRQLREYDIVVVEITGNAQTVPALIRQHAPDTVLVGLVEGAVEGHSQQSPREQLGFVAAVRELDVLGVLLEEAVPYYRLLADSPERVRWLGIPYPLEFTEAIPKPPPAAKEHVIEIGGNMLGGRNALAGILLVERLRRRHPSVRGRAYLPRITQLTAIRALSSTIECCVERPWPDYFRHHVDAFAVLNLDPRRSWGRIVLDAAAAAVPYVGSNTSHCAQHAGVLTCDPFDVDSAYAYLCALLENPELYERVTVQQREALAAFDEAASRERFWGALETVGALPVPRGLRRPAREAVRRRQAADETEPRPGG